jgi:predicted dehydrogenase
MGDVRQVTAIIGSATGRYGDVDEYGEGLLHFSNGVTGTLAAGWVDVANPVTFIVSGTEGHAHIAGDKLYFKSSRVKGATGKRGWTDLPEAWPHAFELFLDAVSGKPGVPLVTAREAATRNAVMEALYVGATTRSWAAPVTR